MFHVKQWGFRKNKKAEQRRTALGRKRRDCFTWNIPKHEWDAEDTTSLFGLAQFWAKEAYWTTRAMRKSDLLGAWNG